MFYEMLAKFALIVLNWTSAYSIGTNEVSKLCWIFTVMMTHSFVVAIMVAIVELLIVAIFMMVKYINK